MKINYLIVTKTNLITKYYKTLENFRSLSLDNFLADYSQQLLAERLLHLITQTAIDINHHILSRLNHGNSTTNFESFIEVAKYQAITPELAQNLASSTEFIKHLIYQYDDIDPNQVFKAINFALKQYPLYVRQINSYLISLEEHNA
ncbi:MULTISPECIES: DUF86 domain-containing protein [unclassified Dolichospermum]|jgi:uncharacterized protein YutE (UPF0331/DUF86 family)|uniref:type VII toxin-antitoxin system HepT family RNase toxin n=1 Tax=Dolichospermum sp. UHCC 0299 TaxID=2590014 RepID=UPI00029B7966|nr:MULTISPECIES: HepT-like ribonuclease domain-containing protein [unclassified Dolichospermum]AFW97302.1 hypothetical protein ANA_P20048 [Anabaena sp. 90]MBO1054328.1 DUF86 domain-containing protein [Dolichospermum sp. DET73]MTJ15545.1 DUF86 domain-containing protein [Dolichospermum sp. UHCC 0299]MTJ23489.1 DUF86 domain-containing protein [Dolichospermum sp. UHCC 0352]MTJ41380.1 DUF86 domain-containing protein [Dolichospermum sp. UHCC 0406]